MFNDTFTSPRMLQEDSIYPMKNNSGIAWASDADLYGETKYDPADVVPPPNWRVRYPNYTTEHPPPNIAEWQAFQVWMRTAGLPTFSKLYQRNDDETMKAGTYEVNITDSKYLFNNATHCSVLTQTQISQPLSTREASPSSSPHERSWVAETLSWVSPT